jgi:hypothetical protein
MGESEFTLRLSLLRYIAKIWFYQSLLAREDICYNRVERYKPHPLKTKSL